MPARLALLLFIHWSAVRAGHGPPPKPRTARLQPTDRQTASAENTVCVQIVFNVARASGHTVAMNRAEWFKERDRIAVSLVPRRNELRALRRRMETARADFSGAENARLNALEEQVRGLESAVKALGATPAA